MKHNQIKGNDLFVTILTDFWSPNVLNDDIVLAEYLPEKEWHKERGYVYCRHGNVRTFGKVVSNSLDAPNGCLELETERGIERYHSLSVTEMYRVRKVIDRQIR